MTLKTLVPFLAPDGRTSRGLEANVFMFEAKREGVSVFGANGGQELPDSIRIRYCREMLFLFLGEENRIQLSTCKYADFDWLFQRFS